MERMVTPATRPSTSLSEEAEPSIWRVERRVKACGAYLRRVASACAVTVASFSRREGDTTVLSVTVPAGVGEESAPAAGESGAPAQGTTPARRRGRRYFVGFMPGKFQLAKLKAFARQGNTHFRVYAEPFLVCMRGIFLLFRDFVPKEYPNVVNCGVVSFAMEHGEWETCGCETKVEKFAEKVGRNWQKVEDFSGALCRGLMILSGRGKER